MMHNNILPLAAAATSSLLAGLAVVATRDLVGRIDPLMLAFLRYAPAGLCFLPVLLRARSVPASDWLAVAALGGLFYALYPYLFTAALSHTSALHGAMMMPLLPIITLGLAIARGQERPTWQKTGGMALAFAGVATAFVESLIHEAMPAGAWKGDLIMLASLLPLSVFNVMGRPYIQRHGALTVTAIAMPVGSVVLAAVAGATGHLDHAPALTMRDWAIIGFLSLGAAALANFLWILALGRIAASRVALFALIPPIVAAIAAALLLGEWPGWMSVAGLSLVIAGIVLANRGRM